MTPKNQINFFLTDTDIVAIEHFTKENGFVIVSPRDVMNGKALRLDSLLEKPQSLLVKKNMIPSLVFSPYPNSGESYVDTSQSPVIEFDRPTQNDLGDEFFFGRLYYQTELFESNKEYATAVKLLFSWVKKQLKKLPEPSLSWVLASEAVLALVETQNAKLLLNSSPTLRIYFDKHGIQKEALVLI
jgi:hypothetical protein